MLQLIWRAMVVATMLPLWWGLPAPAAPIPAAAPPTTAVLLGLLKEAAMESERKLGRPRGLIEAVSES